MFGWWKSSKSESPVAPSWLFESATRSQIEADSVRSIADRILGALEADNRISDLYCAYLQHTRCCMAFDLSLAHDGERSDILSWDQACDGLLDSAAVLASLAERGLAQWLPESRSLRVPDIVLAGLSVRTLTQIGLPPIGQVSIKTTSTGMPFSESFAISLRFSLDGRPLSYARPEGMTLDDGVKTALMPPELFLVADTLATFAGTRYADLEDQNYAWACVAQVLRHSPLSTKTLELSGAAELTPVTQVSVRTDKDGNISPVFIASDQSEGETQYRNLLDDNGQSALDRFMKSRRPLRQHVCVGSKNYAFMTPEVKGVMGVIRQAAKGDARQRAAFIANPTREIVKQLENQPGFDDIARTVSSIFVETPEFLSGRVEAFGEWEPKKCAFMRPMSTQWFGDSDRYCAIVGGEIVFVTPHTLAELIRLLSEASKAGEEILEFDGQKLEVAAADIEGLSALWSAISDAQLSKDDAAIERKGQSQDENDESTKKLQKGPLIKTNLETLEYAAHRNKHPGWLHALSGLRPGFELYQHQHEALEWLSNLWRNGWTGALLADDMGLGKTLECLTFLKWLSLGWEQRCTPRPSLVIAPVSLVKNWEAEGERWFGASLGKPLVLMRDTVQRLRKMPATARHREILSHRWVIASYETVRDKIELFSNLDWGLVVLDEAQKIKNPLSLLTETVKSLKSEFLLAMTGTPVENSFMDLWSIMDAAVPGFLKTAQEFNRNFCNDDNIEIAGRELHEILTGKRETETGTSETVSVQLLMRRLKHDRLKGLPKKIENVERCIMPPAQAAAYREVLSRRFNGQIKDPALTVLQRLQRTALSPDTIDEDTDITDEIIARSARLTALFRILDEIYKRHEKVLIFVTHLRIQSALARTLKRRYKLDHIPGQINGQTTPSVRHRVVETFQNRPDGTFDVLILASRAAGTGLTLTAANHVVHLERWWNPAVEDQCSDRAYRIGQKRDVTIHIPLALLTPDDTTSFDAKLHDFLEVKRARSLHLLMPNLESSAIKEFAKDVLSC